MTASLRAWLAVLVVIAWGTSLGWLGLRAAGRSESTVLASQATSRLTPGGSWFAVTAGDIQIGMASVTLDTLSPGYRILENLALQMPRPDGLAQFDRSTEYVIGASLSPQTMISRAGTSGGRRWSLSWDAGASGGVRITSRDELIATGEALSRIATPVAVLPYRLALTNALQVGDAQEMMISSGWPFAVRRGLARVLADTTLIVVDSAGMGPDGAWMALHSDTVDAQIVLVDAPSGPVRLTIDHRGGVVAREFPFGVRWTRTDFYFARSAFLQQLDSTGVTIARSLPVILPLANANPPADTSTGIRQYRVTRRNGQPVDPASLQLLDGGRQRMRTGKFVIGGPPEVRARGNDWAIDPMIQHLAPPVVAFADEMVAAIQNERWDEVFANIRRRVRVDTAASAADDAVRALAEGRARPDGIARLFVALARAKSVRARYVIGVRPSGDTLYTHAWAEVYSIPARAWVAVDPVRGHPMARTDLIRIGWAGSSHPEDFLSAIADVRFTLVPNEPADAEEAP